MLMFLTKRGVCALLTIKTYGLNNFEFEWRSCIVFTYGTYGLQTDSINGRLSVSKRDNVYNLDRIVPQFFSCWFWIVDGPAWATTFWFKKTTNYRHLFQFCISFTSEFLVFLKDELIIIRPRHNNKIKLIAISYIGLMIFVLPLLPLDQWETLWIACLMWCFIK